MIIVFYSIIILCIFAVYLYPNLEITKNFKANRWFIPAIAPVLIGSYLVILNAVHTDKWSYLFKNKYWFLLIAVVSYLFPL